MGKTPQKEVARVMEEKALQVFNFQDKQVRVVTLDNDPWWVAKDVCDVLGYVNAPQAVEKHCKRQKKYTISNRDGITRNPETIIIPESDVYRLIIRSRLPKAEQFEVWVMEEVLPAIRKTGGYSLKDSSLALQRQQLDLERSKLLCQIADGSHKLLTPESRQVLYHEAAKILVGHALPSMLPAATEKWYSATELGDEFGVSAQRIGRLSNEHDLKAPDGESNEYGTWIRSKSEHGPKEVMTWVYYEAGRKWFVNYFEQTKE